MRKKIYPKDFDIYHTKEHPVCPFYVEVANDIYNDIRDLADDFPHGKEIMKEYAIMVACYFEDKMSGLGIWNAFMSLHKKMYGRVYPFFGNEDTDVEEASKAYDLDEPNCNDLHTLLWMVISRNLPGEFINPYTPVFALMSMAIEDALDQYEDVEVNESLYDFIYGKERFSDYFNLKEPMVWISNCSYLHFAPITQEELAKQMKSNLMDMEPKMAFYAATTNMTATHEVGPLALLGKEWYAEMCRNAGMEAEAELLDNLEYHAYDYFKIESSQDEVYELRDSDGVMFTVVGDEFPEETGYVAMMLVKYAGNPWEMEGISCSIDEDDYDNLCERKGKIRRGDRVVYELLLKLNHGKQLAFFKNKNELRNWLEKLPIPNPFNKLLDRYEERAFVIYLDPNGGVIFMPDTIHAIKCGYNPYYRQCSEEELQEEIFYLLFFEPNIAPLVHYLLDNNMIVDGNFGDEQPVKQGKERFLREADFMARCLRRHTYFEHETLI